MAEPSANEPKAAFWKTKSLSEMNTAEWESLCDGCALCCLVKLEDEDTGEVHYTDVVCKYLDNRSCQCTDYQNRHTNVPACVGLKPEHLDAFEWLPQSCSYRLLAEGKELPAWHHLVTGSKNSIHLAGRSVKDQTVSEEAVHPDALEDHIIQWLDE